MSSLGQLIDDAALFPPGNAPMPAAVAAHRRHRAAAYRELVGPFLCPAGGSVSCGPSCGPATGCRSG